MTAGDRGPTERRQRDRRLGLVLLALGALVGGVGAVSEFCFASEVFEKTSAVPQLEMPPEVGMMVAGGILVVVGLRLYLWGNWGQERGR